MNLVKRGILTVAVPSKPFIALSKQRLARTLDRLRRRGGKHVGAKGPR